MKTIILIIISVAFMSCGKSLKVTSDSNPGSVAAENPTLLVIQQDSLYYKQSSIIADLKKLNYTITNNHCENAHDVRACVDNELAAAITKTYSLCAIDTRINSRYLSDVINNHCSKIE